MTASCRTFPPTPPGHATFGTACCKTCAALASKESSGISVTFVSDNSTAPQQTTKALHAQNGQTFSLRQAIEENKVSRINPGVHWNFDATGGETVGVAIAQKTIAAFNGLMRL